MREPIAPAVRRTKRKDGLKRQAELMAAALELFAEKGYGATSIDDIIARAGTARGTFYLHFGGKGDLFARIVETYLGEMDALIRTLDISLDLSNEDLRQLYRESLCLFTDIPAVRPFVRIMLCDAMGAETQQQVRAFFDRVVELSARYIARAQGQGRVSPTLDPVALSVCIVGSVKEVILCWALGDGRIDLAGAAETALEVYFRGMMAECPNRRAIWEPGRRISDADQGARS